MIFTKKMIRNASNDGKKHAVVKQRIKVDGTTLVLPVLYFQKSDFSVNRFNLLIEYFLSNPTKSISWMQMRARAVGLFWDFLLAQDSKFHWAEQSSHRQIIRRFSLALLSGTYNLDNPIDELGLYWEGTSKKNAKKLMYSIIDFLLWCRDEGFQCDLEITTRDSISPETLLSFLYVSRFLKNLSFLSYLKNTNESATELQRRSRVAPVDFGASKSISGVFDPVKAFPTKYIDAFINHGFILDQSSNIPHERIDMNGKMIALLLFYGGLRRSEPLHIWYNDIQTTRLGESLIVHPEHAKANLMSVPKATTRKEYLESIGMIPRNRNFGNKSLYAGWKNLFLGPDYTTPIYWIDNHAKDLFNEMFEYYMRYRKGLIDLRISAGQKDHPFLFVSNGIDRASGKDFRGSPYSYSSFGKAWNRALARTSKILNESLDPDKNSGLTPHAGRHFYGKWLSQKGIDAKIIQVCMHHRNASSQLVYTVPTHHEVCDALNGLINNPEHSLPLL